MTTAAPPATTAGELAEALRVLGAIKLGGTIPILYGCRLTPGQVAATNLEMSGTVTVPELDVTAVIPMGLLRSTIESFDPKAPLEVEVEDNVVKLRAGRGQADLVTYPAADYPELPKPAGPGLELSEDHVTELRHLAKVASTDFTRPVLTAVRIAWDEGGLFQVTATDSYRMGHYTGQAIETHGTAREIQIPAAALTSLPKGDGLALSCERDGSHVTIRRGALTAVVRTVEGQFPGAARLFPDRAEETVTLTPDGLVEARRFIASLGEMRKHPLRVTFTNGETDLLLEVVGDEGRRAVTVGLEAPFDGDTVSMYANQEFFSQMADYGGGRIGIISPLRPFIFAGPLGDGRTGLLMPIRLNS